LRREAHHVQEELNYRGWRGDCIAECMKGTDLGYYFFLFFLGWSLYLHGNSKHLDNILLQMSMQISCTCSKHFLGTRPRSLMYR